MKNRIAANIFQLVENAAMRLKSTNRNMAKKYEGFLPIISAI
jgi:hypothetical protein